MTGNYKSARQYYNTDRLPSSHIPQEGGGMSTDLNMKWVLQTATTTKDPRVWGQPFWIMLHISSAHYPHKASPICAQRTKEFILSLPYILPCEGCSEHAQKFIDNHTDQLEYITSGRTHLFRFFVNFHNYVNERYGKKIMTEEEAFALYNNPARVNILQYE